MNFLIEYLIINLQQKTKEFKNKNFQKLKRKKNHSSKKDKNGKRTK
jgi:hypothetical protein